jgi:hypothetical protein
MSVEQTSDVSGVGGVSGVDDVRGLCVGSGVEHRGLEHESELLGCGRENEEGKRKESEQIVTSTYRSQMQTIIGGIIYFGGGAFLLTDCVLREVTTSLVRAAENWAVKMRTLHIRIETEEAMGRWYFPVSLSLSSITSTCQQSLLDLTQ